MSTAVPAPAPTPAPATQHDPPSQPASPVAKRTKVLVDGADGGGSGAGAVADAGDQIGAGMGVGVTAAAGIATPTPIPGLARRGVEGAIGDAGNS